MKPTNEQYDDLVKKGLEMYKDFLTVYIGSGMAGEHPEVQETIQEQETLKELIFQYDNDNDLKNDISCYVFDYELEVKIARSPNLNEAQETTFAAISRNIDKIVEHYQAIKDYKLKVNANGHAFKGSENENTSLMEKTKKSEKDKKEKTSKAQTSKESKSEKQNVNGATVKSSEKTEKTTLMENKEGRKDREFITIEGRVGVDAKVQESDKSGKSFTTFTVAENKSGQEKATWHNVQLWEGKATEKAGKTSKEDVQSYLSEFKKGDYIKIRGYEEDASYTNKEGNKVEKKEFIATNIEAHKTKEELKQSADCTIKGRLGADPEHKTLDGGKKVVSFSVATGEIDKVTQWQKCQVFDKHIESSGVDKLKKGDTVEIKGYMGKEYTKQGGEKAQDLIIAEAHVLKHAEDKSQKQEQTQGSGLTQ
ncbi:MAG: single-stranded DNA-binding protein [Bacteroidia bacterium]